jgi:peptidoglycan hydrolase-like protein with peptidoglycan-binding domain
LIINNNYKISQSSIPGQILEGAVIIPEEIVVHIGHPDEISQNIKVPFIDYIKNVASSELYPTWHENALRANIHAIVSITLNRYFTDWYRSRGYDFDITSSTQFDQAYSPERGTFENINQLVDEIFNQYVVGEGRIEPFYAQFCDGRLSKCQGLYQWGSVDLANEGYSPLEILQYYYEDNISIKTAFIEESIYRFESPLKLGDSGLDVLRKELQLDRISENFPAIPKIDPIDGYYDETTEAAVKEFQRVFDLPVTGIIDKSTWYKITNITTAVKKLAETTSEGILLKRFEEILSGVLLEGDVRPRVGLLQYFLVVISLYFPAIPEIAITGVFDNQTRLAVIEYQKTMNIQPTGLVDLETWESIYNQARGILNSLPVQNIYLPLIKYPKDYAFGDQGPGVFVIQEMLQYISNIIPQISYIEATQIFDEATKNSVISFQNFFNLEPTGIVNEETWNKIVEIYRVQRYAGVNIDEITLK